MQQTVFPTRINVGAKSSTAGPKLSALRESTMREHSQLLGSQVDKLSQANQKINNILALTNKNKLQCQNTIANLHKQINDIDNNIANYQKTTSGPGGEQQYKNNIKNLNNQYLNVCKERVRLANQISIKNLKNLNIQDKKSPAHEIFKWIMAGIYNQPGNKYFWPNFKQEALQKDKGKDLIQRLGKVSAMGVKQQQKIKTQQFLQNYPTYAASPQLQKVQPDVDKVKQIAQLFKRGYIISSTIDQNQRSIQKHKQQTLEKDEQYMRWKAKSQALKDRIKINNDYLNSLNMIEQKLAPKAQQYNARLQSGQTLRRQFQSMDKSQQWNPSINLGQQPKGNCQCNTCSIF